MKQAKASLTFILPAVLFLAGIASCCWISCRQNQGHLVYALDDAYIHMAMAKNFSLRGVWGVTRYEFTSSSSSLLWTLLLALDYRIFGVNEISPLLLNALVGILFLLAAASLFRTYELPPSFACAGLIALVFLVPLVPLVFTGQEHILHLLLSLLFLHSATRALSGEEDTYRNLLFTGPLLGMVRYEGLFLVLVVCCFFAIKRKLRSAVLLGAVASLPALVYGIVSQSNGWFFLPSSILLKGNLPGQGFMPFLISGLRHWAEAPHMIFLVLAMIAVLFVQKRRSALPPDLLMMNQIYVAAAVLHMQFAGVNYFYRYEAYLVGLGLSILFLTVRRWEIPKPVWAALPVLVMTVLLLLRGARGLYHTPHAAKNIYEQQYQMGLFVRSYYQGRAVAANDIGAINYQADIRCLDLLGLGTLRVGAARREGSYTTETMRKLAGEENVAIAIVFDRWFPAGTQLALPREWERIASWKISRNVISGDDTVSFYAIGASQKPILLENLRNFSGQLPPDVIQLW